MRGLQVWKDALQTRQPAPYMRHFLSNGLVQDFHFCPYEVPPLSPPPPLVFADLLAEGSGVLCADLALDLAVKHE